MRYRGVGSGDGLQRGSGSVEPDEVVLWGKGSVCYANGPAAEADSAAVAPVPPPATICSAISDRAAGEREPYRIEHLRKERSPANE